jgi:hypothetical protein
MPGTPTLGRALLLRRQAFAPRVHFDAELWQAFAASPLGDLAGMRAAITERLARLGYEKLDDRAWRDGEAQVLEHGTCTQAHIALALSAQAVGFTVIAGTDIEVRTCGHAEVASDVEGEVWAWSDSAFPGPHRAGAGRTVPAGQTHAVQIVRAPAPCVRLFRAEQLRALMRIRLSMAPAHRACALTDLPARAVLSLAVAQPDARAVDFLHVDAGACAWHEAGAGAVHYFVREQGSQSSRRVHVP